MKLGIILGIAFWEGSLCAWEDNERAFTELGYQWVPFQEGYGIRKRYILCLRRAARVRERE